MTTITKEQAQKIIDAADEVITALAGTNEDVHPESDNMLRLWDDLNDRYAPPEVVRELARIALASLEVAPVGEVSEKRCGLVMDGTVDLGGKSTYRIIKGEKAMKRLPLGTKFYIAPPAPVVDADPVVFTDERNLHHIAMGRETSLIWGKQNQEVGDIPLYRHAQPVPVDKEFIPKNLDKALGVVGVALPESKEEFNFQTERWIQRLIDRVIRYADEFKEQPVPVVPDEMATSDDMNLYQKSFAQGWNDCRDAMLNSAKLNETVSETNKLNSPATPDCWIPVSDQLPEKGQRLIAFVEFNSNVVTPLIKDAEYTGSTFRIGPNTVNTAGEPRVTHWIPLPNPPQQ